MLILVAHRYATFLCSWDDDSLVWQLTIILEHFFLMITNWATPVGCSGGYMAAGESGLVALLLLCPQRELPAAWVDRTLPPASHHD